MTVSLLQAKDLSLTLNGRRVLQDINFSIKTGEIVTVVGPNGSGKTSFLRCLIGAQAPTSGEISRKAGLSIGYVPQKLHLDRAFPMTVARFLRLAGKSPRAIRLEALQNVGLEGCENQQMADLSGGQLQRALLAQALLGDPDILVMDEATRGLDQPAVAGFYRLIDQARQSIGCAVLMVSHDLHVVMSASDRVICLNGHVCCEGSPTVVSEAPEYRRLFGLGTEGALALYQHDHDHDHDHSEHPHD